MSPFRALGALAALALVEAGKKKQEVVEEIVEEVATSPALYVVIAILSVGLLYNFYLAQLPKVEVILVGCGLPKRGMGW